MNLYEHINEVLPAYTTVAQIILGKTHDELLVHAAPKPGRNDLFPYGLKRKIKNVVGGIEYEGTSAYLHKEMH